MSKLPIPPIEKRTNLLVPYVEIRALSIKEALEKRGFHPVITETWRTKMRQYWLYCQGRTVAQCVAAGMPEKYARAWAKPNAVQVTWTLDSKHCKGKAIDWIDRKLKYAERFLIALHEEAAKVEMKPKPGGGDRCHIEWRG